MVLTSGLTKDTAPFNTSGEQEAFTSRHIMGRCRYHFSNHHLRMVQAPNSHVNTINIVK